ncbi:hypothetical protein [Echinicola sp. 20G]|uniref:SGNH/GDSL hydrolase family protein n=1 Tax=Echinicola sp. 20G TaxID=2781961 RepID=UPI001910736A|nr:hypothetical protein [Echinicola sp. 20G]
MFQLSRMKAVSIGLLVLLTTFVFLTSCEKEQVPERDPIQKVLVIGNSITFHPPAPEIGWNNAWGMAASAPENDFFSVLSDSLRNHNPEIEIVRENVYPFEKFFGTLDFSQYEELKDLETELLIIRLGENVNTNDVEDHNFANALIDFAAYLKGSEETDVIITTCFWQNPIMNEQLKWAAQKEGWTLVDITYLSTNDANMALGEFEVEGVSRHPSDQGMKEIARLIWEHIMR